MAGESGLKYFDCVTIKYLCRKKVSNILRLPLREEDEEEEDGDREEENKEK